MWYLRGILVFGMYIEITLLSHDAHVVINDTIIFVMLRWLRGIIWLFVPVLVSVSGAIGTMCCWCQWHHMTREIMLNLTSIILTLVMQWCFYWYVLMPVSVLMVSHDPKGHVPSHFSCLDLRNTMVLLVVPLASHDTDAGTSGITWLKRLCCTSFQLS